MSLSHFLGDAGAVQRPYFPPVLNASPRLRVEGQSGAAALRDRDEARLTLRYSW